jgi:hypothetical protein
MSTEREMHELSKQIEAFQSFVDSTPNQNNDYAEELALVHDYFEAAELEIAPIVVLDRNDFRTASLLGSHDNGSTLAGFFLFGRTIIANDEDPGRRRLFGTDIILGDMFHEAAHSTGFKTEKAMVLDRGSYAVENEGLQAGGRNITPFLSVGMYKVQGYGWRGIARVDEFLEEAFAELTRVRGLSSLGREQRADGEEAYAYYDEDEDEYELCYVGADLHRPLVNPRSGTVNIPMRFIRGAKKLDGGRVASVPSFCGVAAYGLDMLDQEVPGLYDAMLASRADPRQQAVVINMINSVEPGLYRTLRPMPYSISGFKAGTVAIDKAIQTKHRES